MALLALLLTLATPDADADARCAYLLGYVADARDAAGGAAGPSAAGVLYFIGKLRGRDPAVDVAAAIRTARAAAKQAGVDPRADLARCIAELRTTDAIVGGLRGRSGERPPTAM